MDDDKNEYKSVYERKTRRAEFKAMADELFPEGKNLTLPILGHILRFSGIALQAFAVKAAWNVLVAPVFGAPKMTMLAGCGLVLMYDLMALPQVLRRGIEEFEKKTPEELRVPQFDEILRFSTLLACYFCILVVILVMSQFR